MTLTVLRINVQVVCKMVLSWDVADMWLRE